MGEIASTGLSSKGQVVIPEPISAPSMREFDEIIAHAARAARQAGLRRSDVAAAIRAARSG